MSPAVGSVMLSGPRPRSQLGRYCCTSPYASVADVPTNSSSLSTSPDPARRRFVSGAGPVAAAPVGTIAGGARGGAGGGGGGGGGAVAVSTPGPRYTSAPVFVLISAALPPRSRNPTTVGRLSPPPSVTDRRRRSAIGIRITHSLTIHTPDGMRWKSTRPPARGSTTRSGSRV